MGFSFSFPLHCKRGVFGSAMFMMHLFTIPHESTVVFIFESNMTLISLGSTTVFLRNGTPTVMYLLFQCVVQDQLSIPPPEL